MVINLDRKNKDFIPAAALEYLRLSLSLPTWNI